MFARQGEVDMARRLLASAMAAGAVVIFWVAPAAAHVRNI